MYTYTFIIIKCLYLNYAFSIVTNLRGLNPATSVVYASDLFVLKNGKAYNKSNVKAEDVGVKAIDENTLQLTLEKKIPYFTELLMNPIWMPLRQDIVSKYNGYDWAKDPKTFVTNGPYKFVESVAKDHILVTKNTYWHDVSSVKIENIKFTMIDDQNDRLTAFNNGQIDYMEQAPITEIQNLKATGKAKIFPYIGTYYFEYMYLEGK